MPVPLIVLVAIPIGIIGLILYYHTNNVRQDNVHRRRQIIKQLGVSTRRPKFIGFFHPYWYATFLVDEYAEMSLSGIPVMQVVVEKGFYGLQ